MTQRHRIEAELQRITSDTHLAGERLKAQDVQREQAHGQWAHQEGAIHAMYAAAEHAYLDAVATAMRDPAVTEAVQKMSGDLAGSRRNHSPADPVPGR
jgi:hypothetical protein